MYFNTAYFIFALPPLLLGLYAQFKIKSAYSKYLKVRNRRNMTGYEAAQRLLRVNGLDDVQIVEVPGELTDHYDPRNKRLSLSPGVARTDSLAGLSIVAHEVGHAVQDKEGYLMLKVRGALVPAVQLGSWAGPALFIVGMLLASASLSTVGLFLFSSTLVFSLVTLPVEYNASSRAIAMLESSGLLVSDEETRGAQAVLSAAALTYVAAAVQSLANILYYASLLDGRRRS